MRPTADGAAIKRPSEDRGASLTGCHSAQYVSPVFSLAHEATPVAAPSKAWVCDCSLAGIAGSNPSEGKDVCLL